MPPSPPPTSNILPHERGQNSPQPVGSTPSRSSTTSQFPLSADVDADADSGVQPAEAHNIGAAAWRLLSALASCLCFIFTSLARGFFWFFSNLPHLILVVLSFVYRNIFLCTLPSRYTHRVHIVAESVRIAVAHTDTPRPWEETGAAVDTVRDTSDAFRRSVMKEWELTAGACSVIFGVGVTILQTSSLTEKPVINMIGVIAVIISLDGILVSFNQHRHVGNLSNLENDFHFAADVNRLKDAHFFGVDMLFAGPGARLAWSLTFIFIFFLFTYASPRTAHPAVAAIAQYLIANNITRSIVNEGSAASGGSSGSANSSSTLPIWCFIVIIVFIALSALHTIVTAYHFAQLGSSKPVMAADVQMAIISVGDVALPGGDAVMPEVVASA